jgi:hypothetical protein
VAIEDIRLLAISPIGYVLSDLRPVEDDLSILHVATRVVTIEWVLVRYHAMSSEVGFWYMLARLNIRNGRLAVRSCSQRVCDR